jgi:hypothetical protein
MQLGQKNVSRPYIWEGWIMTRNWINTASHTLAAAGSNTAGRRRRDVSPCLENLEGRLSLSGIVGQHIGVPAIVGQHIGTGVAAAAIQGNHIGAPEIIAIL